MSSVFRNLSTSKGAAQRNRAAVFVDYDNLFSNLYRRTGSRLRPTDVIDELLLSLRQYLSQEIRVNTASHVYAYADFSKIRETGYDIKRALYLQGVEPRFVPASQQRNAAELQLVMDLVELTYTHEDIRLIVIVTGDRPYLPVIRHTHRSGRRPLVVMLHPTDDDQYTEDVVMDAIDLLPERIGHALGRRAGTEDGLLYSPTSAPGYSNPTVRPLSADSDFASSRPQVEYRSIVHPGALAALDVIEEHFGQYDEIYLTPLLRKLSELVGGVDYDPKAIISELENAGAVWLEKRKGYPYDYTVLIIDPEHPDVVESQMAIEDAESMSPDYYDLDTPDQAGEPSYYEEDFLPDEIDEDEEAPANDY